MLVFCITLQFETFSCKEKTNHIKRFCKAVFSVERSYCSARFTLLFQSREILSSIHLVKRTKPMTFFHFKGLNSVFSLRLEDITGAFTVEPVLATGSTSVNIRVTNGSLDYENPNQRKFIILVSQLELFISLAFFN